MPTPALAAPSYLWVAVHRLIIGMPSREFSKLGLFFVWWLFLSSNNKFSLGFIYDWFILGTDPRHFPPGARKGYASLYLVLPWKVLLMYPCEGSGAAGMSSIITTTSGDIFL